MSFVDLDTVLVPSSGAVATAAWGAQVNDNVAALAALVSPPWRAWSPFWATINNPGNYEIQGVVWKQGREVRARASWRMGTTTTYTSGQPLFPLPHVGIIGPIVVGTAFMTDASTGAVRSGTCVTAASSTGQFVVAVAGGAGTGVLESAVPWTWAAGDTLTVDLCYRSAT